MGSMYRYVLLLAALAGSACAGAQSARPQPAAANTSHAAATTSSSPPVTYETAALPEDRAHAWEMLRAASGLGDPSLKPFYLSAHYKTYDAYGKPKGEGSLAYVWAGAHKWRVTYMEGAAAWSQWRTEKGTYLPKDQCQPLQYPADLIIEQFLNPLGSEESDKTAPAHFTKQLFGRTMLSCFTTDASSGQEYTKNWTGLKRACTVPDRPLLLLRQGDYNVFFEQPVAFQHRIAAKRILMKDGADAVVDVDLDLLETANSAQIKSLEPPADAALNPDLPAAASPAYTAGYIINRTKPFYPETMKQRGIQGTVRLAGTIGVDGKMKDLQVLHSPALDLTDSAEEAVKRWIYSPYMKDGKPVEVQTRVNVTFTLGH